MHNSKSDMLSISRGTFDITMVLIHNTDFFIKPKFYYVLVIQ